MTNTERRKKWVSENREKWNEYMRERRKRQTIEKGGKPKPRLDKPLIIRQNDKIIHYSIKGNIVSISIEDKELFESYRWSLCRAVQKDEKYYLITKINRKTIYLHRLILNLENKNIVGDHINGNPLDCTRPNIRAITQSENVKFGNRHKKIPHP